MGGAVNGEAVGARVAAGKTGLNRSYAGLSGNSVDHEGAGPWIGVFGVDLGPHFVLLPVTSLGGRAAAGVCGAKGTGVILDIGAGVGVPGNLCGCT